jgi:hypothetical protein
MKACVQRSAIRHRLRPACLLRAWLTSLALAVVLSGTASASAASLSSVDIPSGVGYLNSVTCPTSTACFVAGQTSGSAQRGLVLHWTQVGWQSSVIPGVEYLNSISCVDSQHCTAVGVTSNPATPGAGIVVQTTNGHDWSAPRQPAVATGSGDTPLNSVSCTQTLCMAVGAKFPGTTGGPVDDLVWISTGGAWRAVSAPVEQDNTAAYISAVDCEAASDCWVVGQGVWQTTDAGRSWTRHDPPNATGLQIAFTWSLLSTVEFSDATHGIVAGGDQCGGDTDHCPGVVFRTADAGASWSHASDDATPFIEALTCRAPGLTSCLASAATFTPIQPGGATTNTTNGAIVLSSTNSTKWGTVQRLAKNDITSIACPTVTACFAVGGDQPNNVGAVYADHPLPAAPADVSIVATALPSPSQAFGGVARTVVNASITLTAMLALTFPSQLFNRTFEDNYDEIVAIRRRSLTRISRGSRAKEASPAADRTTSASQGPVVFCAVAVAGAIIGSLRDPDFGANSASALSFGATLLTVLVMTATTFLVARGYRARVHAGVASHLTALPAGLVVAAVCVLVSRIAAFRPGYLYGVVCGVAFAGALKRRQNGQLTAVASAVTLGLSVACWYLWVPVNHAVLDHHGGVGLVLLDDALASIFVGGLTGTVISLLPLRFMPGQSLFDWHRGAWAAAFGLAGFGVVEILLRPARNATTAPGHVGWLTAAVLFVIFGLGSLGFREYFARHIPAQASRIALGGHVIAHLGEHAGRSEAELATLLGVEARHLHAVIDRLERAGWIQRDDSPSAYDVEVPLRLSRSARSLYVPGEVSWLKRRRMTLALTRAERAKLDADHHVSSMT